MANYTSGSEALKKMCALLDIPIDRVTNITVNIAVGDVPRVTVDFVAPKGVEIALDPTVSPDEFREALKIVRDKGNAPTT